MHDIDPTAICHSIFSPLRPGRHFAAVIPSLDPSKTGYPSRLLHPARIRSTAQEALTGSIRVSQTPCPWTSPCARPCTWRHPYARPIHSCGYTVEYVWLGERRRYQEPERRGVVCRKPQRVLHSIMLRGRPTKSGLTWSPTICLVAS